MTVQNVGPDSIKVQSRVQRFDGSENGLRLYYSGSPIFFRWRGPSGKTEEVGI